MSSKILTFYSCLDNNEDNFEFFDINNNNETKLGCIFDENLIHFDQPDDTKEINNNFITIESSATLLYNHIYQYVINSTVSWKTIMKYLHLLSVYY